MKRSEAIEELTKELLKPLDPELAKRIAEILIKFVDQNGPYIEWEEENA